MNIFSFGVEFSSEEDCIAHFKAQRDIIGLTCKCKKTDFFWIKSRLSYECKSCRKRITLRSGTIMENLKIGKPDATEEEIVEACKKARIHTFILSLPDGYNTVISESSLDFSGGEKQRLSIARMILKDAPILLFDEATAAVDACNARLIQQALEELGQGKTKTRNKKRKAVYQ